MAEKLVLTDGQQHVFDGIKSFLEDNAKEVFILRGYAGTGKTLLITFLGNYLLENNYHFDVLTPTGRAAKVIRRSFANSVEKYGFHAELADMGCTIHSQIYSGKIECKEVENPDLAEKTFKYYFPLNTKLIPDNRKKILIIDESSMIGDTFSENEFLQFGSGRLLYDLLEYKRICGIEKIIFVGDDAQLPPVSDSVSSALTESYFTELGLGVASGKLTEVVRQKNDSVILKNAETMRSLLDTPRNQRSSFNLELGQDVSSFAGPSVAQQFIEDRTAFYLGEKILICFTNSQCFHYNQAIRELLFPHAEQFTWDNESWLKLQEGDLLLNNNNTHGTWGIEVYNGDMLRVVALGPIEERNVPVKIKGESKKRSIKLSFTHAKVETDTGAIFDTILLNNSLYAKERDILTEETRALYIDFCLRVREDYGYIKEGSNEFKDLLMKDPYFNSLRTKFGYAITCHKAQGGEWDTVWVDYSKRVGLSDDTIRWCYTATTRARQQLVVINAPHITPMEGLQFLPIAKITKTPKGFFDESIRVNEPGTEGLPPALSVKIKAIKDAIIDTEFELKSFRILGYLIRFAFAISDKKIEIDAFFDGEGVIKRLPVTGKDEQRDAIIEIINKSFIIPSTLSYKPSNSIHAELFNRVSSAAENAGVGILNIKDYPSSYYIMYNLRTDATLAYIQFYYSINLALTMAMPKSELGSDDQKLQQLLAEF